MAPRSRLAAAAKNMTLLREIGRGAYGTVYLAADARGKRFAVKVCSRENCAEEHYKRELRGARLYRAIPPSEGLVRMLALEETKTEFREVFELADDEFDDESAGAREYRPKTLSSLIAGEKALSLEAALELALALAKGLVTLERHHLLHRDVKPGNVIYVNGRPVLTDPGLIVIESEAASIVGTPGYVPPDSFVDDGGDVYSLAMTLKAASFGRPIEELARGPALEADTQNEFFPAWWRILNRATDANPARHYRSAAAFLKELIGLRRAMARGRFVAKLPWIVGALVTVAVVVICVVMIKSKIERDAYISQQIEEADEACRRMKEQIRKSSEEFRKNMLEFKDGK